jgi:endonuclease/exonuclease/phosphatase family metal-dependent hydrolase
LAAVPLRALTWNLMHGRSVPGAGHDLFDEFAAALGAWEWDVALLQEVPPWWPARLAGRLDADFDRVLTSRNAGLPLRRAVAVRWPDLIKSNGGGSNAILSRARIVDARALTLARWPERRRIHAVALASGVWVGNLHLSVRRDAAARHEAAVAARAVLAWSAGAPAVLGGDFNVRGLALDGFALAGREDVDYVFAAPGGGSGWVGTNPRGFAAVVPDRGRLSDHDPLLVTLR